MSPIAHLAAYRWSPASLTKLVAEDALTTEELTNEAVACVIAGDEELLFRDELHGLLVHLSARGPLACASRGEGRYAWRLSATPSNAELTVDGPLVTLRLDAQSITARGEELWPALIGLGVRYADRLADALGADHVLVRRFEEELAPARALRQQRGWPVPDGTRPEAPAAPTSPPATWKRVDPWLRHPDAEAFYATVLGDLQGVTVHEADGPEGPPQWLGTLDTDPAGREDWLEGGLIELADGVWMDPWGATFIASEAAPDGCKAAHHELFSLDPEEAAALWATVLGAEATEHGGRWRLTRDGAEVATVRATEGSEVARWLHYLAVDDLTAAVQRATAAGAEVVEEADDRVRLVDPFGAVFGLAHAPHPPASPAPL